MAKKILNIVLTIIIIITIIIMIYSIIQSKISENSYTNILGYTFLEVITGSMSGTIEIGDGVIVQLTEDVTENDIIVYEKNGQLITHRLILKEEGQLITKGDANNIQDDPITKDMVIGKVIYRIPNMRVLKGIIIGIICVWICICVIGKQIQKRKELNDKSFFEKRKKKSRSCNIIVTNL